LLPTPRITPASSRFPYPTHFRSQIQSIQALAELHAQEVSRSPRDWMGYLDTAARLYRYSFQDNLLIHAQRTNATACAELELWNRSEEHTSELQSRFDLVCRLLLE